MSHFIYSYVECPYAERRYAECRYAEWRSAVYDAGKEMNLNKKEAVVRFP